MAWKIEDINDILNVVKEKADMYPQSIRMQNAGIDLVSKVAR